MPKTPEEYLREPYSRVLVPDGGGGYSAEIMEFPGCFAEGETAEEALVNLENAAVAWIQACLDQGQHIPEPFTSQGYGGKIALRLPRSLHRQAARFAERDRVSLNQFLVSAIATFVGAEDCYHKMEERLHERWSKFVPGADVYQIFNFENLNIAPIRPISPGDSWKQRALPITFKAKATAGTNVSPPPVSAQPPREEVPAHG